MELEAADTDMLAADPDMVDDELLDDEDDELPDDEDDELLDDEAGEEDELGDGDELKADEAVSICPGDTFSYGSSLRSS